MNPSSHSQFPQNDSVYRRPQMDPEPTSARWNGTVTECALYLGIDGGGSRCRAIPACSAAAAHACRIDRHAWSMPNRVVAGPELPSPSAAPYSSSMRAREDFALMHARIGLAGLGRRAAQAALKEIAHPFAPFALSTT